MAEDGRIAPEPGDGRGAEPEPARDTVEADRSESAQSRIEKKLDMILEAMGLEER